MIRKDIKNIRRINLKSYLVGMTPTAIQYKLSCLFCTSNFWAKRSDTKFCKNTCRQLNYLRNKKNLL